MESEVVVVWGLASLCSLAIHWPAWKVALVKPAPKHHAKTWPSSWGQVLILAQWSWCFCITHTHTEPGKHLPLGSLAIPPPPPAPEASNIWRGIAP